jgi:hypothetical protein
MLGKPVLEIVHQLGPLGFQDIAARFHEFDFADRNHLVVTLVIGDARGDELVFSISEDNLADGDRDLRACIVGDLAGNDIDARALGRRLDLAIAEIAGGARGAVGGGLNRTQDRPQAQAGSEEGNNKNASGPMPRARLISPSTPRRHESCELPSNLVLHFLNPFDQGRKALLHNRM